MKVVVNDANILIDLVKLRLLPYFFALGWEFHTTSLVFDELYEEQQEAFAPYRDSHQFLVAELDDKEILAVAELQRKQPPLSQQDCSALHYSIMTSGVLLTSDKNLREFAGSKKIEVHGHLWIFDALVAQGCITPSRASEKLTELIGTVNPKLKLPESECRKRMEAWGTK